MNCSFLDKIYHKDNIKLLDHPSNQKVYEDLEFIYYVLVKNQEMYHTNDKIYEYHMRGVAGNSTASVGLRMTKSDGLRGLLSAGTSMMNKFKEAGLYEEYQEELNGIMIGLIFQRIKALFTTKEIENKDAMATIVIDILHSYIPNWQENTYYKRNFKDSELDVRSFSWLAEGFLYLNNINKDFHTNQSTDQLLKQYDNKIKIK